MFTRKLSISERLYLGFEKLQPPFSIQMVIEGNGNIDISKFEKAVIRSSRANPGTRLALRGKLNKSYWFDTGISPKVHVFDLNKYPNKEFYELPFINRKLDIYNSFTSEVLILKGEDIKIIFRSFHGVMDAKGVMIWAEDVFRELRGQELTGSNTNITDEEFLQEISIHEGKYRPLYKFECVSPIGKVEENNGEFIWLHRKIKGRFHGLVAKISYLLAKLTWKYSDTDVRVMIPVDLRFHNEKLNTTANLSNPLFIDITKNDNWTSVYKKIISKLKNKEDTISGEYDPFFKYTPVSILAKTFGSIYNWEIRNNKYLISGLISNIGYVDNKLFDFNDFKTDSIFFLPVNIPTAPLSMVIVENTDNTEIVLSMPKDISKDKDYEYILDYLENQLKNSFEKESNNLIDLDFNNTDENYPKNESIISLFEKQVLKNPEKIALFYENNSMIYKELNEKSNILANFISSKIKDKNNIVAILMDNSFEFIISVLAVLKSGNAYLPIDPSYPKQRINFMLDDSHSIILLSQISLKDKYIFKKEVIYIDEYFINKNETNPNKFESKIGDLAYVIYTSGSTGNPKGVEIGHKSLFNYCYWANKKYIKDKENSIFPLFTSISFDLTITSVFVPLISGGSIEIYSNKMSQINILKIFKEGKSNIVKLTPSHLKILKEVSINSTNVKKIIVGGENLPASLTNEIHNKFDKKIRIFNEYGPTEATVGCMIYEYDEKEKYSLSIPIGKPIANTKIYLLNQNLEEVIGNEQGEIYISGICLSKGYINRKDLINQKFINNPKIENKLMYKTGDLAKKLENGNLEYLGRIDEQVKIRGYRVELSDIENNILNNENIQNCSVLFNEENKILIAFYQLNKQISKSELINYLKEKLPDYMIPDYFLKVEKIPLTNNGKVDKEKLLESFLNIEDIKIIEPNENETALVKKLKIICSNVLSVDKNKIDIDSSLFDLSIDSLKMVILLSKISDEILSKENEKILLDKMQEIFINPTIRNLEKIIKEIEQKYSSKEN